MRQLPLAVRLDDAALFSTYHAGPNAEAVAFLRRVLDVPGPVAWLRGPAASGKTHLLQATCAATPGSAYLPADDLLCLEPAVLDGWEERSLVCLDDVDRLAGRDDWEVALFGLFNRLSEAGRRLVVSGQSAPSASGFRLPDLASRLAWGAVFRLQPLGDEDKLRALQLRAAHRGLDLPEDTGRYLLRRLPRDMAQLCGWLDRLDTASLAAQKRLTIPFVREVLAAYPPSAVRNSEPA
ncbi:MAG: DnaA regulatory inactivator Hda [Gammaproteobacteria bacterium]